MNKEKEEMLEKLNRVKQTAENYLAENKFDNYIVKNVVRYNKEIQLTEKKSEDNKAKSFHLYVVELENTDPELEGEDLLTELEYLEDEQGNLYTISDLIQEYEGFENIKDVVDKTKENEEKPEEEQDEELKEDSLEELESEKEKEECAEVIEEDEENIKSIAEIEQEEDTKKLESMNHLQEIDADTKVNYYKDMEKALGLKGVQKFVIVYSEDAVKLSETQEQNSSRYSMIAVMDDGSMLNLDDRLEEIKSEGKNSIEGRIQTDADEKTRVENNPASMYRIKGSNSDETFSFENGEYGEIKAYYGNMTRNEGTTFVGTQIETNNVLPTSKELREQASDRAGQYYADYKKEETEKHLEHGDDEIAIENSDGRPTTIACESPYVPDTQITWEQFSKLLGDKDIKDLSKEFFEQYDGNNGQELVLRMQAEYKEKESKDLEVTDGTFGEDDDGAGGTQGMARFREGPWDSVKH